MPTKSTSSSGSTPLGTGCWIVAMPPTDLTRATGRSVVERATAVAAQRLPGRAALQGAWLGEPLTLRSGVLGRGLRCEAAADDLDRGRGRVAHVEGALLVEATHEDDVRHHALDRAAEERRRDREVAQVPDQRAGEVRDARVRLQMEVEQVRLEGVAAGRGRLVAAVGLGAELRHRDDLVREDLADRREAGPDLRADRVLARVRRLVPADVVRPAAHVDVA